MTIYKVSQLIKYLENVLENEGVKLADDYEPSGILVTKDDESIMLWRVE